MCIVPHPLLYCVNNKLYICVCVCICICIILMENVVVMLKHYTHYENSVCTNIQLTLLFDNNVVVFLY